MDLFRGRWILFAGLSLGCAVPFACGNQVSPGRGTGNQGSSSSGGGTGGSSGGGVSSSGSGAGGASSSGATGSGSGVDATADVSPAQGGDAGGCPFGTNEAFLWSGTAPGSAGATVVEQIMERSAEAGVHDRAITGVSKPSLFPFLADHRNGAALVVIPGGGYTHITFDKEGTDIASWLNSLGVSAFVLKYRLPVDYPGSPWIPLADAQRAIRTIRKSATSCGIDPSRIGVIGFSAGGHMASQLETRFSAQVTAPQDDVDGIDARPSFSVLMYPVISMDPAIAHAGSKMALLGANPTPDLVTLYSSELQVTSSTPATFLGVSSKDQTVDPQNTIRFDDALKTAGVPEELHVYQDGAHGVGIRDATGDMAAWPQQCAAWLAGSKFISDAGG
jgi:acetyl esterase/lipase